jgi:flagellar biogenesis protein FliO
MVEVLLIWLLMPLLELMAPSFSSALLLSVLKRLNLSMVP